MNVFAGDGDLQGGSVNLRVGTGAQKGGLYVKNPNDVSILSVTGTEMSLTTESIDLHATLSTITLTAVTEVAISAQSIVLQGGAVEIDSHDLVTTYGVGHDVFRVSAADDRVAISKELQFNANEAMITHTHTGATTMTLTSPTLILSSSGAVQFSGAGAVQFSGAGGVQFGGTGEVVFGASGSKPTSTTCVKGTIRYDLTKLYLCVDTNTWMQVTLNTATIP